MYKVTFLKAFWLSILISFSFQSSAALLVFTDQAAWEAALNGQDFSTEDFNGDASDFGANSAGNIINDLTVNIIGHDGDSTRQGLTGNGQFEGEVDSSDIVTSDGANVEFKFDSLGFAILNLTDNSSSLPDFNVHEIAIRVLGDLFLVSDLVGLTSGTDKSAADSQVAFLGFVSTSDVIDGFTLLHGDAVRSVNGGHEAFYIDTLLYTPVPAPTTLFIFLMGLVGCALMRRGN